MIRLPPTSISLSASDLDTHLQQINIYHGLLKQGFRKKDVLRYFDEQRQSERLNAPDYHELLTNTPTTLDLVTRRLTAQVPSTVSGASQATVKLVDNGSRIPDFLRGDNSVEAISALTANRCFEIESPGSYKVHDVFSPSQTSSHCLDSQNTEESPRNSLSMDTTNTSIFIRHAPRQSSLLRFAHTISSDPSEAGNDHQSSLRSEIDTRQSSNNWSSEEPECEQFIEMFDELVIDNSPAPSMHRNWTSSRSRSSLDPEAQEFTPLALPPPFPVTHPVLSSEPSPPSVTRLQIHVSSAVEASPTTSSPSFRDVREFPSSPPILQRSATPTSISLHASPAPPSMARLSRSRDSLVQAKSQPQAGRYQHLDGSILAVYDDSVPASEQPQTPADLSRRSWPNEFNPAYTAPPGVMYGIGIQSASRGTLLEIGEQSPTERAIEIRSRRNREFARSARVEGLRILRARGRGRRSIHNDQPAFILNNTEAQQDNRREIDLWRDDLEADRVGEENFTEETEPIRELIDGLRVVSGNERPRGP